MRRVVLLVGALVVGARGHRVERDVVGDRDGGYAEDDHDRREFSAHGPCIGYAIIPVAMKAYFSYVNARRGDQTGSGASVAVRSSSTSTTTATTRPARSGRPAARRAGQGVRRRGCLGTEVNLGDPAVPQLEEGAAPVHRVGCDDLRHRRREVPVDDRLAAERTSSRGRSTARRSPATARTRRSRSCYQNDDYGRDYVRGIEQGLGDKTSNIVGKETYEVTAADVRGQIAKLRATGANIFVIVATPKFTVQAYAFANALKWSPDVIYTNSVSATDTILTLAQKSGGGELAEPHVHDPVRQGSGEPEMGQRRRNEAVQAGHGEVRAVSASHRRVRRVRRRNRPRVRPAPHGAQAQPDACRSHEGRPVVESGQSVRIAREPSEDGR